MKIALRIVCVAAFLTSAILPQSLSLAASADPAPAGTSRNWAEGNTLLNSAYALGQSHRNFLQYFNEARTRYGALPPEGQLMDATAGWDVYIASNVPGLGKFIRDNNPPNRSGAWTSAPPDIPLVNRVVTPVNKVDGFRKPLLPPMRLSRDGRIGVVPGSGGLDGNPQPLRIRINRPEALNKHFLESAPGTPTLDPQTWEVSDHQKWGLPGSKTTHFVSICEPDAQEASHANPYACGQGGKDDCYKLTIVGSAVTDTFSTSAIYELDGGYRTLYMPQLEKNDRLYSREVIIRVSEPKTARARIAGVDFSSDYKVSPIRQGILFELNTPADGRIVVTRRQGLPLIWRHSVTGEMRAGSYETVYAVAPNGSKACDASQWGDLKPISHAPFDPLVKNRYPFAKYQFRDPMGHYIPDGEDIKGTYPWLDMDAKNISLMISDANLFRDGLLHDQSRFPNRCVNAGCTPGDSRDKSNISQFTIMGAWTKGKMSVFDNMINYADFRINVANALYLDLYKPGTAPGRTGNKSQSVEVGAYREVGGGTVRDHYVALTDQNGNPLLDANGIQHRYLMKNSSLFDSIENRLNYNPHMKPARPHDVVWLVSSGATSDELSFDDLLNENAFIVSEMVAAYSWKNGNRFRMTGYDGWNELIGAWSGQVKVQNSATTLPHKWVVPDSGDVVHGRIEPVANGGVKGKGLYFNGENTRILYQIPHIQPSKMSESYWFHSLFIDSRSTAGERVILDFPDKSRLTLIESDSAYRFKAYNNQGEEQAVIPVPRRLVRERWLHIGIQVTPSNFITLFVNGFPFSDFKTTTGSTFRMTPGALVLGRAHNSFDGRNAADSLLKQISSQTARIGSWLGGSAEKVSGVLLPSQPGHLSFKGWMDDYKVFSYRPDFETVCNMAHGTLVAAGRSASVSALAADYPSAMHNKVSNALELRGQRPHPRYACHMGDPESDQTAAIQRIPDGAVSIRADMHFPEGPIFHDAPRPDSSANTFCLACHSTQNVHGLTVEALRYRNVPASLDPRRQPTQAPPLIRGNLPVEFIQSINGNHGATGSNKIDEYTLKSSRGVPQPIKNVILMKSNEAVSVLQTNAQVSKAGVDSLRVNTSGLAVRADFLIDGVLTHSDSSAPFDLPTRLVPTGTRSLTVRSNSSNGMSSDRTYVLHLTP